MLTAALFDACFLRGGRVDRHLHGPFFGDWLRGGYGSDDDFDDCFFSSNLFCNWFFYAGCFVGFDDLHDFYGYLFCKRRVRGLRHLKPEDIGYNESSSTLAAFGALRVATKPASAT